MVDLKSKVALVTGSSRGIGAAIARLFAEQGAKVVLNGRDKATLNQFKEELERAGSRVMYVVADVRRFNELETMRLLVEKEFGPVDILVANAGGSYTQPGPIEEISEEGWQASVDGNLTATFLTIKTFLPGMKTRRRGNIITISSTAGRLPHVMAPVPYAASKAGIQIFTQDLAQQVGPYGIRANCIAPETILTEHNQQVIPESQKQALAQMHPLKRLGTPDDVAKTALFLASEESTWLTGLIIDVAGGNVML